MYYGLLLVTSTLLAVSPLSATDNLTKASRRWLHDFTRGKIDPREGGELLLRKTNPVLKKPYLDARLRDEAPGEAGQRYTRLKEAKKLFWLVNRRGTAEDGKFFVAVLTAGLKRKGGRPWDVGGRFWMVRKAAADLISVKSCPQPIRAAIIAAVESSLVAPRKEGGAYDYKPPEAGQVLVPIVGAFKDPTTRELLEHVSTVENSALKAAAALSLSRLQSGRSIGVVAATLGGLEYQEEIVTVADSLAVLTEATKPAPTERDLKAALNIVLDKLEEWKDWRARYALIPMTRRIRSKASIPVLIHLLEEHKENGKKVHFSGTLLKAIGDALADLTGYWAPVDAPEKWRAWWTAEEKNFVMGAGKKGLKRRIGDTKSAEFFGIPVSGNRVVFILDCSGSMLTPFGQATVINASKLPRQGTYESRLDRAKKELTAAVKGMSADDEFNVVTFENRVRVWQKKLVPATERNKAKLAAFLDKTKAWGGTALYDGVHDALQLKSQRRPGSPYGTPVDEIFILSDGAPTAGKVIDPAEILMFLNNWNRGALVRINTIFVGTGRDKPPPGIPADFMKPHVLMRLIAEGNNGKFKQV